MGRGMTGDEFSDALARFMDQIENPVESEMTIEAIGKRLTFYRWKTAKVTRASRPRIDDQGQIVYDRRFFFVFQPIAREDGVIITEEELPHPDAGEVNVEELVDELGDFLSNHAAEEPPEDEPDDPDQEPPCDVDNPVCDWSEEQEGYEEQARPYLVCHTHGTLIQELRDDG